MGWKWLRKNWEYAILFICIAGNDKNIRLCRGRDIKKPGLKRGFVLL